MDLSQKSTENIGYMLNDIVKKLKMANVDVLKPSQFGEEQYEDLKDIYNIVMKKNTFSPNEMQEIVEELGYLRK